eukprot:TRINITY_DN5918_c0_g1_i8.p1 TRINITY_DN5918_c0_g1~~TRINITY_DN5918_c0_g1_i8.p1  ORF type:complete len:488 (+),score=84.16 TRINITY_DN5918_c0_g1_i8:127-1590(+)
MSRQHAFPSLNLTKVTSGDYGAFGALPSGVPENREPNAIPLVFREGSIAGSTSGDLQVQSARVVKQTGSQKTFIPHKPHTARPNYSTQGSKSIASTPDTELMSPSPGVHGGSAGQLPMSSSDAIKAFGASMTQFEHEEVLSYPQVYYTGHNATKVNGTTSNVNNNGYDDERGDYNVVLHDHIGYRYEVIVPLGRGSFGQVVKAFDYKTNSFVACKIIRNKKRFHHQALIEVRILEHLKDHDPDDSTCTIRMHEYFYFRNHLCITFELLSINLYEFIKNNNFQGFSMGLIRRFATQILINLKFLYKNKMIHCDLKPENILLRNPQKSAIKVIDYGSSCFLDERVYTYIQSRFYRSPEVILGHPYDMAIDMWSFGCIISELHTGYPIFPGENEVEQLACIMEVLGLPPKRMVETSTRRKIFFDGQGNPRIVPNSRGKKRKPNSKDIFTATRSNDPVFIDFMEKCLKWDPKERMTPDEALQHDWILEVCA